MVSAKGRCSKWNEPMFML